MLALASTEASEYRRLVLSYRGLARTETRIGRLVRSYHGRFSQTLKPALDVWCFPTVALLC